VWNLLAESLLCAGVRVPKVFWALRARSQRGVLRTFCFAAVLDSLHRSTGLKRSYLLVSGVMAVLSFIFFGFGAHFLIDVIGFSWPAYMTFKALETESDSSDDKFW
jgi:hypothetical protein